MDLNTDTRSVNTIAFAGARQTSSQSDVPEQQDGSSNGVVPSSRSRNVIRLCRYFGSAILLAVLVSGAAYWIDFSRSADAAARAQAQTQESGTPAQFEYFPGQYVNQAKEREEHIQAF
jgi:hypothetical protein